MMVNKKKQQFVGCLKTNQIKQQTRHRTRSFLDKSIAIF